MLVLRASCHVSSPPPSQTVPEPQDTEEEEEEEEGGTRGRKLRLKSSEMD